MRDKRNNFVFSIAGAHGVGKTTVFKYLQDAFGNDEKFKFYPERYIVKNPTYPLGSINKQIAFRGEIFFLQQLLKRNTKILRYLSKNRDKIIVMDRTPICVLVYSKALEMAPKDYKLILDLFKSIDWIPEFIFYLTADPTTIMKRIVMRGHISFETNEQAEKQRKKWHERDKDYLLKVLNYYNEFLLSNSKTNKNLTIIQTDNLSPRKTADKIEKIIFNSISNKKQIEQDSHLDLTKFL